MEILQRSKAPLHNIKVEAGSSDKHYRTFYIINYIRSSVITVLLLCTVFILLFLEQPYSLLALILTLSSALIFSLGNFYLLRKIRFRYVFFWQLYLDITVITLLVYFSGGITSPFYFLYILPIIISSFFLSRKEAFYIAALSFIVLGIISDLMYLQILPFYTTLFASEITLPTFIYNLVMSFIGFISVAALTSWYFDKIKEQREELRIVQNNLRDISMLNRVVLDKIGSGFLISDDSGNLITFNATARELLNIKGNRRVCEIFELEESTDSLFMRVAAGSGYYFEKEIDGKHLGISVSEIREIYSFKSVLAFIILDLTDQKVFEKELKRKKHMAQIGEMVAGITHEIRNPLASISGAVQFLVKDLHLSHEHKKLMDIIIKESNRLSYSIEELLTFTKERPLVRSEFNLNLVLNEILELTEHRNREIEFRRNFSGEFVINADRNRITQIVWNLVNNAVKAVKGDGCVEVSVKNSPVPHLSVKDNGIGMDEEEIKKIFTPFFSAFTAGFGLGMAIVKRALDEHGYSVEVQSVKGEGTEIIIWFERK